MRTYPPAILAIGRNYAEHAAEMKGVGDPIRDESRMGTLSERPVVFMKNPASVIGHNELIIIPRICDQPQEQVDYEGELAIIVGSSRNGVCRDVKESDAFDFIAGYAIANDVSARWWQKSGSGGQFVRGKSFDTFCPISAITPHERVADPQSLRIVTKLN